VPSSVDMSCMPVMATIAMPSTDEDSGAVEGSVALEEPPAEDIARHPTQVGRGATGLADVGGGGVLALRHQIVEPAAQRVGDQAPGV